MWVVEALQSLDAQTHPLAGVAVVDDGSSDCSLSEVATYLSAEPTAGDVWEGILPRTKCPALILRHDTPKGPAAARNAGMRLFPDADLYALLDSDDLYAPDKVEKSKRVFEEGGSDVGVVYSDFETIRSDGLILRQHKEPFSRARLIEECIINCDSVVSRNAVEAAGGFDESLRVCEDLDLWLRLTERYLAVHIPEALVGIRIGAHSSTATVRSDLWKACHARVFQKLKGRQ
jgi:glycosyltransferase involved in cell wall biosynthesis